jgi:predicted ATPase
LWLTKGHAVPEVEHAYTQAYVLCQQVGETPQLAQVLHGLWRFYNTRGQLHTAQEFGETLRRLVQCAPDPALAVLAHYAPGAIWFYRGALPVACQHLEEAIAGYTTDQRHTLTFRQVPGGTCHSYVAWILWLLGYPDQALTRVHEALALAHALSHPYNLSNAWCYAAFVAQFRRDVPAMHEEATVGLSAEHGSPFWRAVETSLCGWARVMPGQGEEGLAQVRQGIASARATGAALFVP